MTEVLAERKIMWFGQPKTVRVVRETTSYYFGNHDELLAYWIEGDEEVLIPDRGYLPFIAGPAPFRAHAIDKVARILAGFEKGPE